MKLDRCLLAVVAVMAFATATTGCKLPGSQGDDPEQGPSGAQTQTDPDGPRNGGDDSGMRRARRHRGRHGQGRGRWDGRQRGGDRDQPGQGNRGGWGNRGNDGPQPPPSGPDTDDR